MSKELKELTAIARFQNLEAKVDEAKKRLHDFVKGEFPVGCCVSFQGKKNRIYGKVECHGCWWSDPSSIYVRNEKTGKRSRIICASSFDTDLQHAAG